MAFAKFPQNLETIAGFGEVLLFFLLVLMFKTPHLLLLIVFQVCSVPIGRLNRCVPGTHLESRHPQYAQAVINQRLS